MISLGIPFQHAEGRSTRRNPQARFAFAQCRLRALALGNVEVHAKNAIRPDVGIGTEPARGAIRHEKAKFVMIGSPTLRQTLLLGIAGFQVLEGLPLAQLFGRNDSCFLREAEETGLLSIDDGLGATKIGLKGPHLRRVQGQPQATLVLVQRLLRLLQMRDLDDSADRAYGLAAMWGFAINPPSVHGYPPNSAVATPDTMHAAPFPSVG